MRTDERLGRMARRRAALGLAASLALLLAACGGSTTETATEAGGSDDSQTSVSQNENETQDTEQASDDVRDVEVLSVADGSTTSIRAAVDGDRPVLLWFYAPH